MCAHALPAYDAGLTQWVHSCVDDVWNERDGWEYVDFDPSAASAFATDFGKLAALVYPIEDVMALLKQFAAKEIAWRDCVADRGVGGDEFDWPRGTLSRHYAVVMLKAWARASGFSSGASSEDCTKVAAMLAGWPRNFRKAVSFMVLGWIEGGTFGSGGAKLMKAVVHGGAKPAAKPRKK